MATPTYIIQNFFCFNIPNSTAITYIGYDSNNLEMYVKFRTDTVYRYSDMMYDEFLLLATSPSVGKTWNIMLKEIPQMRSHSIISDDLASFLIRMSENVVVESLKNEIPWN